MSLLQSPVTGMISGGTSKALAYGSACTNGSKLVCCISTENPSNTITVSDPTNGTWTNRVIKQGGAGPNGNGTCAIYDIATNGATTALTVTANFSGVASYGAVSIFEMPSGYAYDASGSGTADNGIATASVTTTVAHDYGFECSTAYPPAGQSSDTGWTTARSTTNDNNGYHASGYNTDLGSATTLTLNEGVGGTPISSVIAAVAYKAVSGDTPVQPGAGSVTLTGPAPTITQSGGGSHKLFRGNPASSLSGLGSGGPFFQNPVT